MKSQSMDMCNGPLLKKVVFYTVPIILTSLLQLLFNAADLVVIGQFCGSVYVGAVGATNSLINLIVNLFIGLSVGAGVTVAQALGAHDDVGVKNAVHTAIPVALVGGGILTVVGVAGAEQFLKWMSTPEDVLPLSAVYMRIYFAGIVGSMLYNYGAAILRAAGDTKSPLLYLTFAGVINVALNLLFVIVFKMDVDGVALATVLSQAISALLILRALIRRTDCCRLDLKAMGFQRHALNRIISVGLPAGLQGSLFSISNVLIQSSINSFGDLVISGNAAAASLEGFVYVCMNAFHQTALNFTGQNVGAGKFDRVRRVLGINLVLVALTGLAIGSTVWLFGRPLLSIYITDSPEAIAYGLTRMTYICLPYFTCGVMDVLTGVLRGLGASLEPLVITVVGVCVMRIVWIYTVFQIPAYHTVSSLYISYPISWVLTILAQVCACFFVLRRVQSRAG